MAGTTSRSRSASAAPTRPPGSPPAPARPTRGPDGAAQTLSGSCTDRAGNTNSNVTATFKYDATRPTASGSLARGPDVERLVQPTGRPRPDRVGCDLRDRRRAAAATRARTATRATVSGTCTDVAGNTSAPVTATLNYDATPPRRRGCAHASPDVNGWYTQPVALNVTGSDATVRARRRARARHYSGPDGAAQQVSGTCTDRAGNTSAPAARIARVRRDAARHERRSRTGGDGRLVPRAGHRDAWSRTDRGLRRRGLHAHQRRTRGRTPAERRSAAAAPTPPGTQAAPAFTVKFDATQPADERRARRGQPDSNGWFNHPVGVVASGSDGGSGMAVCTAPSYCGPDTRGVSLGVSCRDNAGNASAASRLAASTTRRLPRSRRRRTGLPTAAAGTGAR